MATPTHNPRREDGPVKGRPSYQRERRVRWGIADLLCSFYFWSRAVPLLLLVGIILSSVGARSCASSDAAFIGVVVDIRIPETLREGPFHYSEPAVITVRQPDGTFIQWELEPVAARYLRVEDFIVKQSRQRPAVFREGRQLTTGVPFRRDEVALPLHQSNAHQSTPRQPNP